MKLFPEHKGRFITASVLSACLLVLGAAAIANSSFGGFFAQANIASESQIGGVLCSIPGVGCSDGTIYTSTLNIDVLEWSYPYYGGQGIINVRTRGYKTRPGVTATCTYKNVATGENKTKNSNKNGEARVNLGHIYGETKIKVICTNVYNTYQSSDDATFFVYSRPDPVITMNVAPLAHVYGGGAPVVSTIDWGITNEVGCKLEGPGISTIIRNEAQCSAPIATSVPLNSYGSFVYSISYTPDGTSWNIAESKTITVAPPAPGMSITANGASGSVAIPSGSAATIAWQGNNIQSSSCIVSNNRNSTKWYTDSGSQTTAPLTQPVTYSFNCKKMNGSAAPQQQVVISIQPALPPTCTLSASPVSVVAGGSATLTYSTSGTVTSASIVASPGPSVGSVTPLSGGTRSVSPTQSTAYTMTVGGPGGNGTCGTTVTVAPLTASTSVPILSLVAVPERVQPGKRTTLAWSATGVTACTLTENGATISTQSAGTGVQRTINATTVYKLSCTGGTSPAASSVTVTVLPTYIEPGQN